MYRNLEFAKLGSKLKPNMFSTFVVRNFENDALPARNKAVPKKAIIRKKK